MKTLIMILAALLLAGCSFQTRAEKPRLGELLGYSYGGDDDGQMSMDWKADDDITDPCHYKLRLENALLKKALENCDKPEPVEPQAVDVPVDVELAPIKLKVVPVEEDGKTGAVSFPPPTAGAAPVRTACCPPC